MSNDALERISELIQPSLRQCGVELFDAHWDGRSTPPTLRLLIDREGGVTLDDCETVSRAVGVVLDTFDPVETAYQLEVSSPGAERALRNPDDWRRHLGRRVNVRFRAGDADTVVEGRLLAVGDDAVEVEAKEGRRLTAVAIPVPDILAGRLAVEFGR